MWQPHQKDGHWHGEQHGLQWFLGCSTPTARSNPTLTLGAVVQTHASTALTSSCVVFVQNQQCGHRLQITTSVFPPLNFTSVSPCVVSDRHQNMSSISKGIFQFGLTPILWRLFEKKQILFSFFTSRLICSRNLNIFNIGSHRSPSSQSESQHTSTSVRKNQTNHGREEKQSGKQSQNQLYTHEDFRS